MHHHNIGLDWIGLDWIRLLSAENEKHRTVLRLDWIGSDRIGLDWIGLDYGRQRMEKKTTTIKRRSTTHGLLFLLNRTISSNNSN